MPSKTKKSTLETVTLAKPSSIATDTEVKPLIDISEDEQWRIINQTGILNKLPENDRARDSTPPKATLGDEIFNAIVYAIPFSTLLFIMEILVHRQYSREPSLAQLMDRMIPGVPMIFLSCFYALRYKPSRYMQIFLAILGTVIGSRLIWTVNRAHWRKNMQQCPPLATSWVFAVVMLDLPYATLSLICVGIFAWFQGLSLIP